MGSSVVSGCVDKMGYVQLVSSPTYDDDIYVRDNQDEMLPHANDWGHDNDLNVFVGAVCISSTMVPRRDDGTIDPSELSVESLLSYNSPANQNCAQANCGNGGGNVN